MKTKALLPIILIFTVCMVYGQESAGNIRNIQQTDSLRTFKTNTRKTIIVKESHPDGLSTSTIKIIPLDFHDNRSFVLEKTDPVSRGELTDLDNDGFEELFIFTRSAGSGSSGNVYGFASNKDEKLVKIVIKPNTEDEYNEGGALEGYMGHDSYHFEKGMLVREFPVYKNTDSNVIPTGGTKKVYYTYKNFRLKFLKVIKKE